MKTIFTQTFEGQAPQSVRPDDWRPWINSDSRDEVVRLAVHRHIRNRGSVAHGEAFDLHVLSFEDGAPRHANGNPKFPILTTFRIDKP
jgi:hypothetical protein